MNKNILKKSQPFYFRLKSIERLKGIIVIYQFNNIELDTEKFTVTSCGELQQIEPQVFNLISHLIENKDRIISRDELLNHIWKGRLVSDTSINNTIKSARQALGDDGKKQQIIKTIHSRGYQFIAELEVKAQEIDSSAKVKKKTKMTSIPLVIFALCTIPIVFSLFFLASKYKQENTVQQITSQTDFLNL